MHKIGFIIFLSFLYMGVRGLVCWLDLCKKLSPAIEWLIDILLVVTLCAYFTTVVFIAYFPAISHGLILVLRIFIAAVMWHETKVWFQVLTHSDYWVITLQTVGPSSCQRGRPIDTRPQISDSNSPTGSNIWSQVPQGYSIPRHTDWLTISRKITLTSTHPLIREGAP
jgi:hypothetical protein